MNSDLRSWLSQVEQAGELKKVEQADWDLEIGCLSVLNLRKPNCSALLFDNIRGYPPGYRLITGSSSSANRVAINFNLPTGHSALQLTGMFREKLKTWASRMDDFAPVFVRSGPVLENVLSGKNVNLLRFPAPKWHELDGGRFIGTGDAVITRDPETGEINVGAYRVQAHDERTAGFFIVSGKHGYLHRQKYYERGQPCPVAVSFGHHPLVFNVAALEVPPGKEYAFLGAIMGQPQEVITEEITGLPIPASSEVVIAGWSYPGRTRPEGPFGEWIGYYASGERPTPFIEIERIYFRDDPVVLGSPNNYPPNDGTYYRQIVRSAVLHNDLVNSGLPDVKSAWVHESGESLFVLVSIKQRYAGHAKQAGLLACQLRTGAYFGRYVIVVDDDIDITNIQEVLWALCTRSDPEKDIDVIRRCWSSPLDPMIRKPATAFLNSRAIIDACKPFEWIDEFPREIVVSEEVANRVKQKWPGLSTPSRKEN